MGHGRALVVVVVVMLAFPAVAWANGTLSYSGGPPPQTATFNDTSDTRDEITIDNIADPGAAGAPAYGFFEGPGTDINPMNGCGTNGGGIPLCPPDTAIVVFNLAGGDDQIRISSVAADGFNELISVQNGGIGNDDLGGGPINDTLNGDDGDDTLRPNLGGGILSGGSGTDTVTFSAGPVIASIDGLVNDGPSPFLLNVMTDVENLDGSPSVDSLTGSATREPASRLWIA